MFTDFGVSVFDKITNQRASSVHSIRDVGPRLTSMANHDQIMRGHGPYEPPEVDLANVDGRKCDVWSFGCIMCDILAFACGRRAGLHNYRSVRYDGSDDYVYRVTVVSATPATAFDSSSTELKSEIRNWFQAVAAKSALPWVPEYVDVLKQALVPDPLGRPGMSVIMNGLDK